MVVNVVRRAPDQLLPVAGGCAVVALIAWLVAPRHPIDLNVYLAGSRALLHGTDITAAHPAGSQLPFTYPPFAAVAFLPLYVLPTLALASVAMTGLSLASLLITVRLSLRSVRPGWSARRGWLTAAVVAAATTVLEPVGHTVQLGQVNLVLLAMVLADQLAPPDWRWRGVLTGVAAAIKLTPAIFVLHLLCTRQWRAARTAASAGLATVFAGLVVAPESTVRFWTDTFFRPGHIGGIPYAGNQSLYALTTRLGRGEAPLRWLWLVSAAAVLLGGITVAKRAYDRGFELAALCLVGLTGLLISPVSWDHHWVWLVPGLIALWSARAWLLAAALGVLFVAAPIWWVPRTGNREYDEHGWQLLAGNAYLIAGLLTLGWALVAMRRASVVPQWAVIVGPLVEVEGGQERLGEVRRQIVPDQQLVLRLVRPAEPDRGGT